MIGFLFLFLAVLLNLTKSYCSKKISGQVDGLSATVDITLVRNFLCAVIGAVILALMRADGLSLPPRGWLICLISGVAVGANYIVWVLALRSGVYLFVSTANSASFILAALCGILFFEEKLTLFKGLAILLILLAMVFMGRYQQQAQGRAKPLHLLLLFLVFFTSGLSSITQKWFTRELPHVTPHIFTFYSLLISAVLLFAVTFCIPKSKGPKERGRDIKRLFGWILWMAVCFYSVTYFQTKAAAMLEAIVMYPVYNGSLLAAGSLMAWLCFGEKPNRNSIIGVLLVFAAIVLSRL